MDLLKTYIQVPNYKHSASVQMTLDNDFNVPDTKPDIERVIQEKGTLKIQEIKPGQDKCLIRGELDFAVLYIGDDGTGQLQSVKGSIPFEENINMDGLDEMDTVSICWDMEDLRAGTINSRKLNIRSIIILHVRALRTSDEEVATAIQNNGELWAQNRSLHLNRCCLRGKDQIRVRDEFQLPVNRPNMMDIIWHQEHLENLEIRLQDGCIWIRGQLAVFVLYRDEMMENQVNDVEFNIPVESRMDMVDVRQEMIPDVKVHLDHMNLDIRNDTDGEARVLGIEAVLATEIKIFQEETLDLLQDLYSPKTTYIPERKTLSLDHLILKNKSLCPVREKVRLNPDSVRMLQICHAHANVKIDQMERMDTGILTEGVVDLDILYISSDDRKPVSSTKAVVPFSYTIEADSIESEDVYEVFPSIEQLSAAMTDNDEIEIRMVISLDASVYKNVSADVVCQVREEALDYEKLESMPSMIGHVVMPGDTLWALAKTYFAAPEDIREMNHLNGDELTVGQSVFIVKNMEIFK